MHLKATNAPLARRSQPSMAREIGRELGLVAGVAVTKALRAVPSWNRPVLDASGREVWHIPGANRFDTYPLKRRHQEVVGPKINTVADGMKPSRMRDFVKGFAQGATEAPGTTYRREVRFAEFFRRLFARWS